MSVEASSTSSRSGPALAAGATARAGGGVDLHRRIQYALAVGYVGFALLGLVWPLQPRVFWTMLLPLVPLAIVLMGFPSWRRICPIAFFGEAGNAIAGRLRLGGSRRGRKVPAWLERWFLPMSLTVLVLMLVLRLIATNGDGRWLAGLLAGLLVAAVVVNAVYSGKSWCNFFCPVGVVERIYTDPGSMRKSAKSSQCARCTACKRHCPDVDQENAYWKDSTSTGRRLAFYSFPGVVLAFYAYYWLRAGDWEAYFDGRWTRQAATAELAIGPGFFFAPGVPAAAAALLTLLAFGAVSFALFVGVEAAVGRFVDSPEQRRHLALALASFAAWNLFYLFAGAPTLRRIPYGVREAAFLAPLVATLVLVKRWGRTHERYIAEQGASRLLRNWEFDEPPPQDAGEVYGWIKASRHAREKDLTAYANTVREMIADGLVGPGQLKLLEGVRRQLGISEPEHERILARLSEEERHLFEPGAEVSIESRAQRVGFERALAEALLRGAPARELEELRASFRVSAADQAVTLERLRGAGGPLVERARRQLDRATELRRALAAIGGTEPSAARVFLSSLLAKARDEAVDRVLELLEVAGDGPMIQALRRRLYSRDQDERTLALELLVAACPGAESLVEDLEPMLARRPLVLDQSEAALVEEDTLLSLLGSADPYLRAAAVWAASVVGPAAGGGPGDAATSPVAAALAEALERARDDDHVLVRETAARFAGTVSPGASLSTIETMHLLYAVPLFSGLDPEDLQEISLFAIEDTIVPPSVLYREGDSDADALYVVLQGRLVVERTVGAGAPAGPGGGHGDGAEAEPAAAVQRIETVGPGAVVGDLSVLDGTPRDATVRPEAGPVRVLRIPGSTFRTGLLRRTHVTEWLLGVLAGRIRRLDSSRGR